MLDQKLCIVLKSIRVLISDQWVKNRNLLIYIFLKSFISFDENYLSFSADRLEFYCRDESFEFTEICLKLPFLFRFLDNETDLFFVNRDLLIRKPLYCVDWVILVTKRELFLVLNTQFISKVFRNLSPGLFFQIRGSKSCNGFQ